MAEITTKNEHAVGYVEDWRWISSLTLSVIAILVMTSKPVEERMDPVAIEYSVLFLLFFLSVLVSYPYLHYRLQGGQFQRIPPRYHSDKPFLPTNASSSMDTVV